MRFMRYLIPLLALCLIAGAKKPKVMVRFHVEVNEVSGAPFITSANAPGVDRKITLSKGAEINEDDVVAIFPFPADDGSIGCAFRLNSHGKLVLDTLSTEARGAMLVGFVNGRAVTAMMIDRRVPDGIISIPRGLTPEETALLTKAFPVLGQRKAAPAQSPAKKTTSYQPAPAAPLPAKGLPTD